MNKIKKLLREGLLNTVILKESKLNELGLLLEKEIDVRDGLVKKLKSINSEFSSKLLNFLTSDKIKDSANADFVDYDSNDEKLITLGYKNQRGDVKVNKLKITKLLKYLGSDISKIKDYEIENLISFFKKADTKNIKLFSGEDILKIYHCENYDEGSSPNGKNNMGSCMSGAAQQSYLKIYTNNPNQVKVITLLNPENGKIRGRALLWKMDDGSLAMDRVYTINKEFEKEFNKYAEENNIDTSVSGEVTLDKGGDYDEYPYMDSLMYYTPYDNRLSTYDGERTLQDTVGGTSEGFWSEVHEETIPEDEAVYIEHVDSFVYNYEVVHSWNEDEFLYRDSSDVVEIGIGEYEGKYALLEDCVEYYDDYDVYLPSEEAYHIEVGEHEGDYALDEDIVNTEDDEIALKEECGKVTWGPEEGNIYHLDDLITVLDDYPDYDIVEGSVMYKYTYKTVFYNKDIELNIEGFEGPFLNENNKTDVVKLLREGLLSERVMNFGDDVDYIYNTYFKDNYDLIMSGEDVRNIIWKNDNITTGDLRSELSKKCHKINPCDIGINIKDGNYYRPKRREIQLTYNKNAFNFIKGEFGTLGDALEEVSVELRDSLNSEFTEVAMKGTIHHELAHWADDTLHNKHIEDTLTNNKIPKKNINGNYIEIQAQIHNVVQLKRKFKDKWDSLTFKEMINLSPSLSTIDRQLNGSVKNKWIKDLKTRMYRESLLGKNMANG